MCIEPLFGAAKKTETIKYLLRGDSINKFRCIYKTKYSLQYSLQKKKMKQIYVY